MMAVLYEDPHVVCDDEALTIKRYYFPLGSKRIPYRDIRGFKEEPMGALTGSWRIWGMGIDPTWFHLDVGRPKKSRVILLDVGSVIKIALTPDDHDAVMRILRERAV